MRVLHVNDVANVAYTLVDELARLGVESRLLKPRISGDSAALQAARGRFVEPVEARHRLFMSAKMYRRILSRRSSWDLLHIHYLRTYTYAASMLGIPYIAHVHGTDARLMHSNSMYENRLHASLKRRALRKARIVLVSTPNLLEIVRRNSRRADIRYLPNPVNTKRFSPLNAKVLSGKFEDLKGGAGFTISLPTSIDFEAKGSHIFLEALAKTSRPRDLRVMYLERGRDLEAFKELAAELGVEKHLKPVKPVPNTYMPGLYGASKLVIGALTPRRVFGVTALEAMACRRPVLNTWSPAYYGNTGFRPLPHSVEELAGQLEELMHSGRARRRLAEKQHAWATANHNPKIVAFRLTKVYVEALETGNR